MSKWNNIAKKADLLATHTDIINESYRTKLFKINTDSFNGGNKHLKRSQFNIYTDGSKLEGKCRAGYSIYKFRNQVHANSVQLPQVCTVFQAEILGIKIACEQLLQDFNTYKPRYIKKILIHRQQYWHWITRK